MPKQINIGWVGSGFIGQVAHLYSFSQIHDLNITALAEMRPKLRQKVQDKFNIQKVYKNHSELIKDSKNLDGIVAIVRRYHTYKIAKDILSEKINLFTEKPMAMTYKQANTLTGLAKKNSLIYTVGNMRRHDDGVIYAKNFFDKILKNKSLGKINYFKCTCFSGYDYCNIDQQIITKEKFPNYKGSSSAPDWVKKNNKYNYEKFLAFFSHDLNLINLFFKDKYKIKSFLHKQSGGLVTFDYSNYYGLFDFAYSDQKKWEEKLEIFFSKGKIEINLQPAFLKNQTAEVKIYYEGKNPSVFSPKIEWSWAFKNQALSFIRSLRSKKNNNCSGMESLKDLVMAENIWKKI